MNLKLIRRKAGVLSVSAVIFAFSLAGAFINSLRNKPEYDSVNTQVVRVEYNTIVIDPGHGGFDGGAVGESGVLEKDINLAMSLVLRDLFSLSEIDIRLTRADDRLLYDENDTRSKKTQDLNNRVSFTREIQNPLFLSIHQNKFPVSKYSGLQVYYSPNNEESKLIAEAIQENVKNVMQHDNNREVKKAGRNIYVLKTLDCPSVLVECGFLSNPTEERLLSDHNYRKKLSICIFSSLLRYLDEKHNRKEM